MYIGIVADDLTGAADTAAPFARRGLRASVGLTLGDLPLSCLTADALALVTGTRDMRHAKPTLIASITRRATRRLIACEPRLYYKKIDSTLRGHLAAELAGMRRELPGRMAIVCPAFPANGRTVRDGLLSIHGVPWTETVFAPPPLPMIETPTVRAMFAAAHDPTAAELNLETLRNGPEARDALLDRLFSEGIQTVFCDAETQDDLDILAQTILRRPERYLPVGSAGLAGALPIPPAPFPTTFATRTGKGENGTFSLYSDDSRQRKEEDANAEGSTDVLEGTSLIEKHNVSFSPFPVSEANVVGKGAGGIGFLVVVGSRHPISRQQAAYLVEKAGIEPVVMEEGATLRNEIDTVQRSLRRQYEAGQRITLLITPEYDREARIMALETMLSFPKYLRRGSGLWPYTKLVVTGGETALHLCRSLGGHTLEIMDESEPGVILSVVRGGWHDGRPIITKAGGFGTVETLARCVGLE